MRIPLFEQRANPMQAFPMSYQQGGQPQPDQSQQVMQQIMQAFAQLPPQAQQQLLQAMAQQVGGGQEEQQEMPQQKMGGFRKLNKRC